MELFVADAFTTRRFSGNQAGVALLGEADFPEEGFMRALAGELKHSETAFVRRTGEGSFHIRYFTPAEEVDLCGHATIASFTVLRETGAIGPGTYALHTRSGDLSIQVGADAVWMDMAPPADGRSFSEEEQAEREVFFQLEELEEKLARTLSGIRGAGETEVMLTLKSGSRQVLAQDTQSRGEGERSVSTVTLGRGSGSQEVVPLQTVAPQFRGALVVCAGGDDPGVRLQVIRAVSALTGLGSDCITVCQGGP